MSDTPAPHPHRTSPKVSRRSLLKGAAAAGGLTAASLALPPNLRRALASTSAGGGSISDVEHVVILMQENRSFDEYFGAMAGVRGFDDPTAMKLANGNSVFQQPMSSHADGYLMPFHYDTTATSAAATPGLDHSWSTQHQAWNNGAMDSWIAAKGSLTMGYFEKADIPFHYALAESFTICDNYHCAVMGPTNPNRLYMWTGMVDPDGTGGGPITDNTPAYNNPILSWTTYPERLQQAGITWQVYQEEDNYDDNALAWFKQYATAPVTSPLFQRGMVKRPAGTFETDARLGRLPQVSWIVAPAAQSEHPSYTPAAGAQYVASKLDAIAANPDLWAKTVFILTYDENDGYFDHVAPPTAPAGTAAEYATVSGVSAPIGPGFRVPTIIVSPWTTGGQVCSDLFDHTSLIRFLTAVFGVDEPNISAYRRSIMGDLTSAFQFSQPVDTFPNSTPLTVPATTTQLLTSQAEVATNPAPAAPAANQPLPTPS